MKAMPASDAYDEDDLELDDEVVEELLNMDKGTEVLQAVLDAAASSGVVIDTTEAAEAALKAALDATRESFSDREAESLSRIQFIGSVSHELRAPLASILGYTQILHEELRDTLEPQQQEFFRTILTNVELALALINDLLDFARIDAGRMSLRLLPVPVNFVLREVAEQFQPLVRDKGLTLAVEPAPGDPFVRADEVRLRQVLINLLLNAIKYTDAGSVTLRALPTMYDEQPACALEVSDTGNGIAADFLPELFQRYSREARVARAVKNGAGIGLAISMEFVRLMGGTIDVHSEVGVGSAFTVTLPCEDVDRA